MYKNHTKTNHRPRWCGVTLLDVSMKWKKPLLVWVSWLISADAPWHWQPLSFSFSLFNDATTHEFKDTHVRTHMHSRLHLALCSVEFLMEMWSVAVTFWFVQDPQGSSSLSNLTDHFLCRSAHSSSTSEGTVSIYLFLYVMSVKMSFGLSSYRFVWIHWPDVHNPYWIWHITTCDIISHGVLSITERVFILYALVLRFQSSSYHSRSCT